MDSMVFAGELGRALYAARKACGMSQRELAEAAGLCVNSVGMIERGKKCPTVYTLKRLCDGMHVPMQDLLDQGGARQDNAAQIRLVAQLMGRMSRRDAQRVADIVVQAAGMGK